MAKKKGAKGSQAPATPPGGPIADAGLDEMDERVIEAAQRHGEESEPDHEVGDLQQAFRLAWALLTPAARRDLLAQDDIRETLSWLD